MVITKDGIVYEHCPTCGELIASPDLCQVSEINKAICNECYEEGFCSSCQLWSNVKYKEKVCRECDQALLLDTEPPGNITDYHMNKESKECWIDINNISVHIIDTGEGIVIDAYPKGQEDGDAIASTWALYAEAELGEDND